MICPRCHSTHQVKNGIIKSRQRYCCKVCGYNFTVAYRGKSPAVRAEAIRLYQEGMSFLAISRQLNVSKVIIWKWVKASGVKRQEPVVVEATLSPIETAATERPEAPLIHTTPLAYVNYEGTHLHPVNACHLIPSVGLTE